MGGPGRPGLRGGAGLLLTFDDGPSHGDGVGADATELNADLDLLKGGGEGIYKSMRGRGGGLPCPWVG